MRYMILLLLSTLLLSGCNLGSNNEGESSPEPLNTIDPGGPPTVVINSPEDGDEVIVDEPILISVTATDRIGITSVQLRINDRIVRTVASEITTGDTNKSVLLDYTPSSTGPVYIEVVAFRGGVASSPDSVTLNVRASQAQITATPIPDNQVPTIDPNDPTCRALVNVALNLRRGSNTDFDVIRVLAPGEVLRIVGRLGDNSWWQLSTGTTIGWVDARFVTIYGICTGIPVVNPPTTPTSTAPPTATNTNVPPPLPTNTPLPAATATPIAANLIVTNITGPSLITIPAGESSVTATFGVNITNTGGPITTQFSSIARILPGGDSFDVGVVANLGTNQSISLTFDVTFEATGSFVLEVTADNDNDIAESDEGDNARIYSITVE